ncbi:hypothetical protein ACF1AJ_18320 [Leifsonia sp. NPDC014704]|uniref:hypothetical protein n=1 Tax=Leifsonia sp. NPDC014704 TaxID=3364123 RepID=UPI0036F4945A
MRDDDEDGWSAHAQSRPDRDEQVASCTLIVRLTSGIELEYDLDPRRLSLP